MNDIKKYTKLGVTKIRDGDILEKDDMTSVTKLTGELQRVFEVHQQWRTETEMRYSVLNDVSFPTPASKYWQSIREQNVFWEQLVGLSCNYQKEQGELELLEIEYDEITGKSKKHMAQRKIKDAEIKQKQFGLMNMRLQAHDRVREIKTWEKIKNGLGERIPQHAINTWFEPIKPIALLKNELVVEVPNQFFYEWIEAHYKQVIKRATEGVSKNGLYVRLKVSNKEQQIKEKEYG
mgnify:CR=1 FL=1